MTFTASDVSSLSQSLHRWELAEYISEAFVILACAGEMIADLGERWLGERRKRRVERHSTMLLVAALSVSLICLVRTNELSGVVIGSLGDKAEEADTKAKEAIADSSTALAQGKDALSKAGAAEASLGKAETEAKSAQTASSSALTIAGQARKEANSFEKDIVSAKKQAAEAESHLADALQRAANATKELAEYKAQKADRRLTPEQQKSVASQLSLPGQPVDLMWYAGSFEGGVFADDIFNALNEMAHWDVAMHPHTPGEGTIPPSPEPAISGLVIFTMPTDRSEKAGKQLHDAFRQAHVPATLASITVWWPWYAKMPLRRDSLARADARLVIMVGNHP